ncbi:MAG: anti-sigma factor [Bacteroidota bacterium]
MKKKRKDRFTGQAAAYVLGALDEKERGEFKRRLEELGPEHQTEVEELRAVASLLPTALRKKEPSSRVRERIMGVVREEMRRAPESIRYKPTAAIPRPRVFWGLRVGVVSAAIVFAISLGIWVNSLLQTIDQQSVQITELKNESDRQQEILALFQSSQVNIVIMNGLGPSPQGHGKVMWDPTLKKAILYITNLPTTPANKDYQLWQIVDNKPVSAGVFSLSAEGKGYFKVEPIAVSEAQQVNAFAVTLEPKGGVPQPTGEMYLLGSL